MAANMNWHLDFAKLVAIRAFSIGNDDSLIAVEIDR